MTDNDDITVTRDESDSRYEVRIGDVLAGFTEYRIDAHGRVQFPHTEIDPAFSGRGLGKILVQDAMADAASRGDTVVPICPFVQRYLQENEVAGLKIDWPTVEGRLTTE